MERRFVIHETDVDRINGHDAITESELKRRLLTIIALGMYGLAESYDYIINILLHGEKE